MAILRSKEISEMGFEELDSHLSELRMDLMKINGILASGGIPEDVGRAREIKRTIARILTYKQILSQKPKKAEEAENPKAIPKGDGKPEKEAVKEKVPEAKNPVASSQSRSSADESSEMSHPKDGEKVSEPKEKQKPKTEEKPKADIKKKVSTDKIKKVSKKKR